MIYRWQTCILHSNYLLLFSDTKLTKIDLCLELLSFQLASSLLKSLILPHWGEKERIKVLKIMIPLDSIGDYPRWSTSIYLSYRGYVSKLWRILSSWMSIITFIYGCIISSFVWNLRLLDLILIFLKLTDIYRPTRNRHLRNHLCDLILGSLIDITKSR